MNNLFAGIHEVRMRRLSGMATGYFDSEDAAFQAIENEPTQYIAAWVTLNPITKLPAGAGLNPAGLRAVSSAAADSDILRRVWLLIDCDPQRPAGTNSTNAEKQVSRKQAEAVRDYLRGRGWPEPILADSSNGWHLLYRIDLPNDDDAREAVKAILGRLAGLFNTSGSRVDVGNFNAARVCKFYGSWFRKGEHTEERPWRRSAIVETPESPVPVSADRLLEVARENRKTRVIHGDIKLQRLVGFLDYYGVPTKSEPRQVKGGWAVPIVCPWADEHSGESNRETEVSYIPGIGNGFKCFHAHCVDRHWKELRCEVEKRNPALPPYFSKRALPKLVHSEVARSFIADNEDFVCVYDQDAETAAWVNTRWAVVDKKDNLLRRALRDYLDELFLRYPEPDNPKHDPRTALLQSPFLSHVLTEVRPLLPKKSKRDFDADPWLLALPDGMVVELGPGTVRPIRREDCITRRIDVSPDATMPTPRWDSFLEEITVGNQELAEYLVRLCGLCMSGHPEQILVFFFGGGRNGKGVLLRLIANILGPFAVALRPNEVTYAKEDSDRMKRTFSKLEGKRLALVNESVGKRLNIAALKLLSGGDKISGAKMRQDDQEYEPTHKLILLSNERPDLPADPAIRGRLHFVPFLADFSGDKGDRFIESKLWAEREGILHKLIVACADVKQDGLRPPAIVTGATDELMAELDTAAQFIEDRVYTGIEDAFTPRADVEEAIRRWMPGTSMGSDWRMERIVNELKLRFKYGKRRVGEGGARSRPYGFFGMRLEAPGS